MAILSLSDAELDRAMRAASQLPEFKRGEFLSTVGAYHEKLHNLDAAIALATACVSQSAAGTAYT
jgi:anthranilate/para-aminobenzoate synthase component I